MSEEESGIKVILLGESSVGKTSLIKVAIGKKFNSSELTTYSANYSIKKFNYNGKEYTFNLWDTIGQEKYRALTKMFFKDSKIIILVYDITAEKTFKELEYWYGQVVNEIGKEGYYLAIVGNKKDLYNHEKVKEAQGKNYAESKKAKFKLTSAKDDPLSFNSLLEQMFKEFIDNNKDYLSNRKKTAISNKGKKKGKCC
jgi:small GTP-binding protein